MSNFIDLLKNEIDRPENSAGRQGKVQVSHRALLELIHNYERLDTYHRAASPDAQYITIQQRLHHTIQAAYEQQNKNAETTLMLIMDTLRPLMEERHNKRERWAHKL